MKKKVTKKIVKKKAIKKKAAKKKCVKKPGKPTAPDNVRVCKRKTEGNQ